jgi:DNA polymerase III sliding clamp (beta) subunit (PCNA family)
MRDVFNLVRGAVSKKDMVPVLTHFAVHEGHIHGYNGRVHICAPCEELEKFPSFTVPAVQMLAAIDACAGEPIIKHASNTKIYVVDSKSTYKAELPIGPIEDYPIPTLPPARKVKATGLHHVLEVLYPFIGEDASRPWCASIRFEGDKAYATTNVVLACLPLNRGLSNWNCALPVYAVDELLRLTKDPIAVGGESNALTFWFQGGIWMRTTLIADLWPDASGLIAAVHEGATFQPVDQELLDAVQRIVPLCPNPKLPAIHLDGEYVRTTAGAMGASVGGFHGLEGTYHAAPLLDVLQAATGAAWDRAPRVPWVGTDGLKGVLVGLAL